MHSRPTITYILLLLLLLSLTPLTEYLRGLHFISLFPIFIRSHLVYHLWKTDLFGRDGPDGFPFGLLILQIPS